MKKLIVLISMLFFVTGCSGITPDSPSSEKYATQNKNSSLEYSLYINKQITVFTNQLSTRMGICKNITEGYNTDNEVLLAEQSLIIMQDTYDETYTVYPPNGSDDDRETVLAAMEASIGHMENYITDLKENNDVSGYCIDFENDFNQLTGLATLYYE